MNMKADSSLFNLLAPDVVVDIPKVVETLKPGAHLLALSPIATHHSNTIGIEDAGMEIRDTIAWVFANERNDVEMRLVTVARKPLQGTVAENTLKYGTGGINVDACRVGMMTDAEVLRSGKSTNGAIYGGLKPVDWRSSDREPQGRWPANLTHDNSPAVVALFPDTGISRGGNSTQINVNSGCYNWNVGDKKAIPNGVDPGYGDSGSASRFFYSAPCLSDLLAYLIKLVTPPNGTVLTNCGTENLPNDYTYVANREY